MPFANDGKWNLKLHSLSLAPWWRVHISLSLHMPHTRHKPYFIYIIIALYWKANNAYRLPILVFMFSHSLTHLICVLLFCFHQNKQCANKCEWATNFHGICIHNQNAKHLSLSLTFIQIQYNNCGHRKNLWQTIGSSLGMVFKLK